MSAQSCPSCGAQSSAKFCPECGTPLGARACPHCGAQASPRAKFCPECGQGLAAGSPAGRRSPADDSRSPVAGRRSPVLPWIIAGTAVLALLATVIVIATRGAPSPQNAAVMGGAPFAPGQQATTDISSLTPRQAADRLFDRIMRASESGDTAQLSFFGPMALNAYTNTAPLDVDARLHVALIHLALGNAPAAVAQADSIQAGARSHLFAPLIRIRAADVSGDRAAGAAAARAFLAAYDAERAKNLTEYTQHEAVLRDTRAAAQAQGAGGS